MNHIREIAAHYWYVGLAFTVVWSALSVIWTLRVERALSRMRAAIKYLQADDSSPRAHESTPTVHIRTGRPSDRIPPPPAAPDEADRHISRLRGAYAEDRRISVAFPGTREYDEMLAQMRSEGQR